MRAIDHPFHWPTMSTNDSSLTSNRTPLHTDTNWPAHQGTNARNREENVTTPPTNSVYPRTTHSQDPLRGDQDFFERQQRSQERRNQITSNESNSRITQTQSYANWEKNNAQTRETYKDSHPNKPQIWAHHPPQHINIGNDFNLPLAPIGTPSTSSTSGPHNKQDGSGPPSDTQPRIRTKYLMQPRRIHLDATQEYTKTTWRDNKNTYHTRYT